MDKHVQSQIRDSLDALAHGAPLAAEHDNKRLAARLAAKAELSKLESEAIVRDIDLARTAIAQSRAKPNGAEKIWGTTYDFVPAAFLDRGVLTAQAVGRVAFLDGRPQGSGFLISDRLFLTNNHVIAAPENAVDFCLEFDYQVDAKGDRMPVTRFKLDPGRFFLTDSQDDLDYTVIAVGDRIDGPRTIESFGYCPLSASANKHALGEFVNVIQHPDGRLKELVLRENRLIARLSHVLHYVADTEPGSSGSPVFNDQWEVIALHHWGGPWRQKVDDQGRELTKEINEGIRISVIVDELREKAVSLSIAQREQLESALALDKVRPVAAHASGEAVNGHQDPMVVEKDGRVTWRIPLEVSINLPFANQQAPATPPPPSPQVPPKAAERASAPDADYAGRSGYKPRFINGHDIPLPALSTAQRKIAAHNQLAEPGDDPFELKYHHFSIVMNKQRRLPFFAACNIDGKRSRFVSRKDGTVRALTVADVGHEAFSPEAAEATEKWYLDPRLANADQTNQTLYDKQVVSGFDTSNPGRLTRMLQRGHMVRRMDPAWGTDHQALAADSDTFHFTNCAPQFGFFNMGKARALGIRNSGNGALWRALENYVLANAVAEDLRVTCFTGPVLDLDEDWEWRDGVHVPRRFWKIAAWSSDGALHAVAMIADQKPVFDAIGSLPEGAPDSEAFDELDKVEDFLTTIAEIEALTDLDFGDALRAADIRARQSDESIVVESDIPLKPKRARRKPAKVDKRKPAKGAARKPRKRASTKGQRSRK